jgi:hypothetical protein
MQECITLGSVRESSVLVFDILLVAFLRLRQSLQTNVARFIM